MMILDDIKILNKDEMFFLFIIFETERDRISMTDFPEPQEPVWLQAALAHSHAA